MNPHPYIYPNIEDARDPLNQGWAVELPDLNKLRRYGLKKEMLEIGKEIALVAYLARSDGDFAYLVLTRLSQSSTRKHSALPGL